MNPPPIAYPRPKRFRIYIAMLFGLCALNLYGMWNSSESTSLIIQELTPLRMVCFAASTLCFGGAGVLFLIKNKLGRPLVILGLLIQFAYMVHFNIKVLMQDGPPGPLEIFGMIFGMAIFLVLMSLFGAVPYTRKFSNYLMNHRAG